MKAVLIILTLILFCIIIKCFTIKQPLYKYICISIILFFILCVIYTTARLHGATNDYIQKNSVINIIQENNMTPIMSDITKPETGDILIYYKYGCEDCSSIYQYLSKDIKGISHIYWVSTQSKNGQSLLSLYPVKQVPMIVLVKSENEFVSYDPCIVLSENKTKYNPEALKSILKQKERLEKING